VTARHIASATLGAMSTADDDARRRRTAIVLVVLVLLLFVGQMVALALGSLEIAALIFGVFVIGWFVLRSYIRGREKAGT
jgi:uncharacterized membrane protein YgdD (TMEM256/DUF423 family)